MSQGRIAFRNRRGEEVEPSSVTATDAKNEFGRVLELAARDGAVVITRHDDPKAILMSIDEFRVLVGDKETKLDALTGEFDALLDRMQTPKARAAMQTAFKASSKQLGRAAVRATRTRG
jgi:prevent-host-death family protein